MPISLGARAIQDVVQKCAIEDRRRQWMIVLQKRRDFRQDVPITTVPAVWVFNDQLRGQIMSWPVEKKLQRRLGFGPFDREGKGAVFCFDILKIRQLSEVRPQDISGQRGLETTPAQGLRARLVARGFQNPSGKLRMIVAQHTAVMSPFLGHPARS